MEKKQNNIKFRFIDLFAGIGGIRRPFEKLGGKCVFTSEYDKYCQITYQFNFGEFPAGDITKIDEKDIPDHDILLAGFPCQPFSIAGVSKKNSLGLEHGFKDKKQGNLFFDIARILKEKKPKAFLLENVKNLKSHDKGRTFKVIENTLKALGYNLFIEIIDAADFVPQHRERILIVGFRKDIYPDINFTFPQQRKRKTDIADILEKEVDQKYTLSSRLWKYLKSHAEKHKKMGNGFGFGLIDPEKDKTTRTLSARYYKDGSEILIKQKGKNPRRLTPRECARLMGIGDDFKIPVSDNQAYKQFGNSVVVPVIEAVAEEMIKTIDNYGQDFKKAPKLEYVQNKVEEYQPRTFCPEISL
ncbi:MAG: DNA (cytosine-5-)-methyltransferase [Candidatus Moranbacteria bacterium CG_4_9_14_3_um_filter_42_9]|nr:MAG: DNA (cytosine-5-)-methyltransferase [Candidatus Moranbacteria bacterium CG_4_9_14_3_um_filter_42_9]